MSTLNVHKKLQLAKTLSMSTVAMPCIAELKLDGVRGYIQNNRIYTRAGHRIHLPKVEAMLETKDPEIKQWINDLEITLVSGKMADRPIVSGMITSAIRGNPINENLLYFNVFDTIPKGDFIKCECPYTYATRQVSVGITLGMINSNQFRKVEKTEVKSLKQLKSLYQDYLDNGYEGIVTKHENDLYQFKRTKHWGRFKAIKTADLLCTGINPGQGEREGMIGSVTMEGHAEGKHVIVKVSGMSHDLLRKPHDYFIGKTIEVKYNSVTCNKVTNQHSLFLPRFLMVRTDK